MRPLVVMMMMMIMMIMILLDLTDYIWMLPAPSRVSMESVDMKHILMWRPLQAPCSTAVLYSVQFQGEFELTVLNGRWVDAPECQLIHRSHCDLTFDLGSDSDYNLRVRAQCGSEESSWTELSHPFNRRDTVLTAPEMTVAAVGDALHVSFKKLPPTAVVRVKWWKKGDDLQAVDLSMSPELSVLHITALQEGAEYCVQARTVLDSQPILDSQSILDSRSVLDSQSIMDSRSVLDSQSIVDSRSVLDSRPQSGTSDTQCVSITGGSTDAAWRKPTTVTVTVITMAGFLFAVFWFIVHCRPHACQRLFHKEPQPHSLDSDWDIQIPVSPEESELCEPIQVSVDPRPLMS